MLSHKASRARICALALCIVICLPSLALAQYLSLAPLEENFAGSSTPVEFRDACFNINLWASVKAHTDYLGEADWAIDRMSSADQQTCFANMNTEI